MKRAGIAATALCLVWLTSQARGQAVGDSSGRRIADAHAHGYIGGNKIVGEPPNGYKDFLVLWVDQCSNRLVAEKKTQGHHDLESSIAMTVCGRVVFKGFRYPHGGSAIDGKYLSYEFSEAYLRDQERPVALFFDTNDVDGVRYHFEGTFVDRDGTGPNQGRHLEGVMSRLVGGHKTTDTTLHFSSYNIIE